MFYADTLYSLKSAFKPAKVTSSLGVQETSNVQIAHKISLQFLNAYLKYIFNCWNWSVRSLLFRISIFFYKGGKRKTLGVTLLLKDHKMSIYLPVSTEEAVQEIKSGQSSFSFIPIFNVMIVKIKVWFCFYVQESNLFLLREGNLKLPALWSAIGLEADVDEGVEGHFLCRLFLWEDQPEGKCSLLPSRHHWMSGGKK